MNIFGAVVFVLSVIVAAQCLTDTQKAKARAYHRECSASSGVDQELVAKGRKGEFVDDPKLKEFMFCFFKKAGFQNEAGDLQSDVIKAKVLSQVAKSETSNVIDKCGVIKRDTPQQTAFDAYQCYWESTPDHISLA